MVNPAKHAVSAPMCPAPFPERWPEQYRRLALSLGKDGPLLRASAACDEEGQPDPEAWADPTGEANQEVAPCLIRKHSDRVLLLATSICFSYCRFCFRRATPPGQGRESGKRAFHGAAAWVARHPEVEEVIFSGGDPLTLPDEAISDLLHRFGRIDHVRRLRIHSRAPVVFPERITRALCRIFAASPKPLRLVLHTVHPDELRPDFSQAVRSLAGAGVGLANQSVLLHGINDHPETLARLFVSLAKAEIAPHYLHHPDRAPGNAAFRLSIARGLALVEQTHQRLRELGRGVDAPPYVIDLPNGAGKYRVASLTPVARQARSHDGRAEGRVRYRWSRPADEEGAAMAGAQTFEWWDVWER